MNRIRIPVLLLLGLLLGGCVTQQDLQLQRDFLETKRRLDEAERALKELQADASGGVRAHVDTLARNQADFQAELDGLRVDLQSMQGRSGEQDRLEDELTQELAMLRDELSLQLSDHEARLAQLETGVAATDEAGMVEPLAAEDTSASVVTPAVTPAGERAPELYERALDLIRQDKDFAAGRELMRSFLQRYPEDSLAVNAAYWVGETYYAEKAYDKAVLQFEEVIQKYGDHPKVASATLKQALSFEALGDADNSTLLLKRVVERFPLSDEATRAKEKLASSAN